jgi:hypothetical protein
MTPAGRPTFEVITPATAEDRRLVSVAMIRSLTGIPSTGEGAIDDIGLGALLDGALATMAKSCRLKAYRALPLTLARESVRATWLANSWDWWPAPMPYGWRQPATLLLPWRAPIVEITIEEGETELVEDTDFRLLGAGVVERIGACWATGSAIVVDYVAGFAPLADDPAYQDPLDGDPMPADLVALIADQVRMAADRLDIDQNLRSEDVPSVWSGTYNFAGGSAIDTGGLMVPLYDALAPYRAPPSIG